MPAIYRRGVEAEISADNPSHSVQLPNRHPWKVAWKPLSVRPALSIRSVGDAERRVRRSVHSLGLGGLAIAYPPLRAERADYACGSNPPYGTAAAIISRPSVLRCTKLTCIGGAPIGFKSNKLHFPIDRRSQFIPIVWVNANGTLSFNIERFLNSGSFQ